MGSPVLEEPFSTTPKGSGKAPHEQSAMSLVSCIIRPESLDAVRDALDALGVVGGITITDVRGFGRQKGQVEHYRGGEYTIRFISKVKLDIAVQAEHVDRVTAAIAAAARTGQVGDGKIFVMEMRNAMRIRTGERGALAL